MDGCWSRWVVFGLDWVDEDGFYANLIDDPLLKRHRQPTRLRHVIEQRFHSLPPALAAALSHSFCHEIQAGVTSTRPLLPSR
uniref:Uncharacterized protein n=1 Tax=Peronospora matthiolae TaxID=2874970 RepID=A0AAV1UTR6_9STRA